MGMPRRIKDFIDVAGCYSLDTLIEELKQIRTTLPKDAEPEVRLRGDDIFGRKLSICYTRWQTKEEIELEEKYASRSKSNRTK